MVVLGVLLAATILIVKGPPTGEAEKRVVITGSDRLQLRASFMRTWQREPTATELRGVLEQHVRQEVLYREALARGYDRDDPGPDQLAGYGDAIMLAPFYADVTDVDLRSAFGGEFAEAVGALEPGSWLGPIRSGYGVHLVKVYERRESEIPPWTAVRASVVRDWSTRPSTPPESSSTRRSPRTTTS